MYLGSCKTCVSFSYQTISLVAIVGHAIFIDSNKQYPEFLHALQLVREKTRSTFQTSTARKNAQIYKP